MKILVETIPHKDQPYPTVGDWRYEDGVLRIRVSEEIGEDSALLVALHELIEVTLCKKRDISQESVDAFDKAYEKTRPEDDDSEAGDAPDAPYRKEHFFATNVERLMAEQMGVNWFDHDKRILALP
jgi:hypothetical protein